MEELHDARCTDERTRGVDKGNLLSAWRQMMPRFWKDLSHNFRYLTLFNRSWEPLQTFFLNLKFNCENHYIHIYKIDHLNIQVHIQWH